MDFPQYPLGSGNLLAQTGGLWLYIGHGNDQGTEVEIFRKDDDGTIYYDNTWSGRYNDGIQFPREFELQIPDPSNFSSSQEYEDYITDDLDPIAYVIVTFPGNESGFLKVCTS